MPVASETKKVMLYEFENRSKRNFVIGLEDHVTGGKINVDANKKPINVSIEPDARVTVTEACARKLETYKELRLIRKFSRKA